MSSTCSVPASATVNRSLQTHPAAVASDNRSLSKSNDPQDNADSIGSGVSYEGRLSLLDPTAAASLHPSAMDFDQAVVLRRIKAECDMLDFQSIHHHHHHSHKDNFMGVDMSTMPLYSAGFSPNHPANGSTAGLFSSLGQAQQASAIKTPEYPSTPVRQQQPTTASEMIMDPSGSSGRQQNDSGISPGSTGAAGSTNSSDDNKTRNGHSESCGEDPTAGSAASGSPYSDHYSGDERRMLLTPTEEDDDDMMDGADDDDDLLDEEGSSRGAGSDVVGEALSRLERALLAQTGGMGGGGVLTEGSSMPNGALYQCNMCSYSAASRFHFQAHLNSHFDVKCTHCDFTARTEGKLRAHIRNAHSDVTGMDDGEMGNTRVPRVSTQGKLKTHKCKHPQCGFVAVTKLDFWEHTKTHIKAEKLLTCPHCPFVTEYKHHLEYHTRNHLNSKPFKCPKCSYSCVNKSMLNSHMKSHSNVYQFRCKDCAYATKYQHSLKLHLRKYNHTSTSTLSLNDSGPMDGFENEVRKVKGRRNAKKPRQSKSVQPTNADAMTPTSVNSAVQSGECGINSNPPPVNGTPPSFAMQAFNFPMYPGSHPLLAQQPVTFEPEKNKIRIPSAEELKCGLCDYATANKDQFSQHLLAHAAADQHHRELANLFGVIPADLLHSPPNPLNHHHQQSVTPLKGSSNTPQQHQMKDYFNWMMANPTLLFSTPTAPASIQQQPFTERKKLSEISRTPTPEAPKTAPTPPASTGPPGKPTQTPLDLSREKDELTPASGPVGPTTNKHRRKGQAFKLERSAAPSTATIPSPRQIATQSPPPSAPIPALPRESVEEEMDNDEEVEEEEEEEVEEEKLMEEDAEMEQDGKAGSPVWRPSSNRNEIRKQRNTKCLPGGGEWGGAYQCSYCDIAFKDVVMYTMHMGYHGFQDPFTCNMCGQSTHDKLAFFLHIARSSHS